MRKVCERIALLAVLVGVLGTLPSQQAAAETVGSVISTTGEAYAEGADSRRPLECGTPIEFGERIVTPPGARAGLSAGDVYLQLDGGTDVAIVRAADGTLSFDLRSGSVRILDARDGGAALVVKTAAATATGTGIDAEVRIGDAGTTFCESAASLDVQGGGATTTAPTGQCVTIAADGSATTSPKSGDEIALAGADGCFDVAVVDHFTPDVALAGAPSTISLAPIDPDRTLFSPCDDPGSGCGRDLRLLPMPEPPGGEIMEQPPNPVCVPGFPGFPECSIAE